ncbi:hypothetical protein, partial [Nocardia sp. NPDC051981]|uniref:hypothetical protein n=1 Tax=Nocardia sp. NPDC051981 TaxID=3155417 RepID=UPI003413E20E
MHIGTHDYPIPSNTEPDRNTRCRHGLFRQRPNPSAALHIQVQGAQPGIDSHLRGSSRQVGKHSTPEFQMYETRHDGAFGDPVDGSEMALIRESFEALFLAESI